MKRAEMELYKKCPMVSDFSAGNTIHPTASDEYDMLISTYMLQLPDKSTLENFLSKELNEKGEE